MGLEPVAEDREQALRARIAELEGKLRQAEAAWAEFVSRVDQCCVEEFSPGSIQSLVDLADDCSPSAQALTRLVAAVGDCYQSRNCDWTGFEPLADAWDAYLAARSGQGEGE